MTCRFIKPMDKKDLILIERRNGVSIYGRVISTGRIGQFEVESDIFGNNGNTYSTYSEAAQRANALISLANH